MGEIIETANAHDRMRGKTIWLLALENPNNVDEATLIKMSLSGIALTFDGDVFVSVGDGDKLLLYEVYKISHDDVEVIVLPLGHWSGNAGQLVISEANKYERRRNLKVIICITNRWRTTRLIATGTSS